jgi:lysophospholipase L1-like esterase
MPVLGLLAAGAVGAFVATSLFATGVMGAAGSVGAPPAGRQVSAELSPHSAGHWIPSWVAAPQLTETSNLPPPPFTQPTAVFQDSTLRQTFRVTLGGQFLRLRFSNAYGTTDLPITAVSIALPAGGQAGASAIQPGTSQAVTFDGQPSVDIPDGAQAVSDPVDLPVATGTNVTVTIFLADGQQTNNITSHPGSRTNSYMVMGNHINDTDVAGLPGATFVAHWYFLSGAEVWTEPSTADVDVMGDSLTDGRGSDTNGNDRWTDDLFNRLHTIPFTSNVGVLNQGLGGNRILQDSLGPNVLARLDRDVIAQEGVKWLIVFEGVNDIGTADATQAAQAQVASDLISAYQQIITRAHAMGIRVYGATITPFGGNTMYDDPAGLRSQTRQTVNHWIRTSGAFDAVLDFDKVARDPANPNQILPAFDSGDHLHLNPAGYQALADSIPPTLLIPKPLPPGFGFKS